MRPESTVSGQTSLPAPRVHAALYQCKSTNKLRAVLGGLVPAAYMMAWLLPALCYLVSDFRAESVAKVGVALVFFSLWHLAFASFRQAVAWSILVFVVLLPFDLFFFSIYREPPGTPVFLAIGDSNLIEAADFMVGRSMALLAFVVLSVGVWLMTLHAARHGAGERWRCYCRGTAIVARPLLAFLVASVLLFAAAPSVALSLNGGGHKRLAAYVKAADEKVLVPLVNLRPIFPFGRFVSLGEYYREKTYLRYAEQGKQLFHYGARQAHASPGRQIYVLVIGETARADRFGLNGHTRGLPSFLAAQENVIPLPNIVSPFTYTSLSVPAMLTPSVAGLAEGDRFPSLVSAFREAGFKTYWVSNQQPIGLQETEISHFAREADQAIFMNLSIRTMHKDGLYDEHLLVPLAHLLAKKEPKQFFVLHTLGSHDSYQNRYPPEFDTLRPSLRTLRNPDHHDPRNKLAVENSYDNAMRYTDYVLAKIIETLAKEDAISALIYTADHGETLFDGNCGRSGHGSLGKQEFPVAAMAWVSQEYKARWPERAERLAKNASAPLTTEAILPTMLNLADIQTAWLDPTRSLASAQFKARKRWVNAPDPIDWDAATTRGACYALVPDRARAFPAIAGKGR